MKTQRQFLCVAWLAVCALLLSACRGPTPVAQAVWPRSPPTRAHRIRRFPPPQPSPPLQPRPDTPAPPASVTPTRTDSLAPPATVTPTPTETPEPTLTPEAPAAPAIAGLSLKPDGKGGMLYVAEKGNPYGVAVGEVVGRVSSVQVLGEPVWDGFAKKYNRGVCPSPSRRDHGAKGAGGADEASQHAGGDKKRQLENRPAISTRT